MRPPAVAYVPARKDDPGVPVFSRQHQVACGGWIARVANALLQPVEPALAGQRVETMGSRYDSTTRSYKSHRRWSLPPPENDAHGDRPDVSYTPSPTPRGPPGVGVPDEFPCIAMPVGWPLLTPCDGLRAF